MRIGIVTIVDYNNYGNRLQNFALQKLLENAGNDVTTIRNFTNTARKSESQMEKLIKAGIKFLVSSSGRKKIVKKIKLRKYNELRANNFNKFTKNYIKESKFLIDEKTEDFTFDNQFDCYVIGSDQVWNYNFPRFSNLDFVNYSSKSKISYAASFGVKDIPNRYIDFYKDGLEKIDFLSVREESGKDIIKDIAKRESKVVLDPTLLLEKKEWLKLIKGKEIIEKRYILTYFLDTPLSKDSQYIKDYAKKNNLGIKQLATQSDLEGWVADPVEFINLFSQAEYVFTDSFHASVFSIIFEREFEVFSRNYDGPSMNSRLDTLLDILNLSDRWHNTNERKDKINYEDVYNLLNKERENSFNFLNQSLKLVEEESNKKR